MTLSPRERADKVRGALERYRGDGTLNMHGPAVDALKMLPPGSLVLTADEAKTVRRPLVHHPRNWRGMWDQMRVEALALLSQGSNVETSAE